MSDTILFAGALQELLSGPTGPVARDLARRAVRVETAAKILLNDSYPPPSTPGSPPHKRTARLQASINWHISADSQGLYAAIGTDLDYGGYLERGTDRIAPRPFLKPALAAAAG